MTVHSPSRSVGRSPGGEPDLNRPPPCVPGFGRRCARLSRALHGIAQQLFDDGGAALIPRLRIIFGCGGARDQNNAPAMLAPPHLLLPPCRRDVVLAMVPPH